MLEKRSRERRDASHTKAGILGPQNPKSVTSRSVTWRCLNFLAWPLCRNVSGIFAVEILEDFAGDFPGGLFWAHFPTKMRRKKPATESAKKSGGEEKPVKNLFCQELREARPGGFQTGGFHTFFGKGPDCVADPLGTVPRRCS